ncbi:proline-rich protein 12-like [Calypte anna]|uniref:proline-rich protein 12-like n=1 Tax=Calypte anna TaxID=9244 RepID=UPI0011C4A088|nr:proline-rich protein 12-like [Calypte anna]
MLRDGAAPLPRASGKGSSANAGDDTTGPALKLPRGPVPRQPAPASPAPPERAEGPRVPSLSRCGLRRRSVPPLLPAAAASLPFNYQLKPQHRAAPRLPPPPPIPFQRREGEAGGLLSPVAGAPPGPPAPPRPKGGPYPGFRPPTAALGCGRVRAPLAAFGGVGVGRNKKGVCGCMVDFYGGSHVSESCPALNKSTRALREEFLQAEVTSLPVLPLDLCRC